MRINIECSPAYALAYVSMEAMETLVVEQGAMVAMSDGIAVETTLHGGVGKAFMRKALGEESFFMGRYTAEIHGAWVAVAPPFPGDLTVVEVTPQSSLICTVGAVVAHGEDVDADVKYAGIRNIVLREGATLLRLNGMGQCILSTYGGLQRFDLQPDQSMVVDTGHLVAWTEGAQVRVGTVGNAVTSVLTKEGLAARITGPATIYVQSRAEQEFKSWLLPNQAQNSGRAGFRK